MKKINPITKLRRFSPREKKFIETLYVIACQKERVLENDQVECYLYTKAAKLAQEALIETKLVPPGFFGQEGDLLDKIPFLIVPETRLTL